MGRIAGKIRPIPTYCVPSFLESYQRGMRVARLGFTDLSHALPRCGTDFYSTQLI